MTLSKETEPRFNKYTGFVQKPVESLIDNEGKPVNWFLMRLPKSQGSKVVSVILDIIPSEEMLQQMVVGRRIEFDGRTHIKKREREGHQGSHVRKLHARNLNIL